MKKIRSKFVFIFLILTLICSCKSTEPANKEKFTDKEKGIENETEIDLEEILEEEFSFEEEYYKDARATSLTVPSPPTATTASAMLSTACLANSSA